MHTFPEQKSETLYKVRFIYFFLFYFLSWWFLQKWFCTYLVLLLHTSEILSTARETTHILSMFSTVGMIQRFYQCDTCRNISLHLSAVWLHQTSGNTSGPEFMRACLFLSLLLFLSLCCFQTMRKSKGETHKPHIISGPLNCQDTRSRLRTAKSKKPDGQKQVIKELKKHKWRDKKEKDWERRGAAGFARAHGEFWQARVFGGALGGDMVGQEGGGGGLDPHQSHSEPASRHQRGPTPQARNPHPVHHTHGGEEKTPLLYTAGGWHTHSEPLQPPTNFSFQGNTPSKCAFENEKWSQTGKKKNEKWDVKRRWFNSVLHLITPTSDTYCQQTSIICLLCDTPHTTTVYYF